MALMGDRRRRKKLVLGLVVLVILAAASLVAGRLVGSRREAGRLAQANQYTGVAARYRQMVVSISASGTLEPLQTVSVRSKVSGTVAKVLVPEGRAVKKGDLLVQLDEAPFKVSLAQASTAVQVQKARTVQLEETARTKPVQAQLQVQQARAALLSAESKLKELKQGPQPEQVAQERSSVSQSKANYEAARADYERSKSLYDAGAIARSQLEAAELKMAVSEEQYNSSRQRLTLTLKPAAKDELAAAEAQVRQAQTNLKLAEASAAAPDPQADLASARAQLAQSEETLARAKEDLESAAIRSPIDGIVAQLSVNLGDVVSPQSQVAVVINVAKLEAQLYVDETEVRQVQPGLDVMVTSDAAGDGVFGGVVRRVAVLPEVRDGVASFKVVAEVDNSSGLLMPGMSADGDIVLSRKERALVVPATAVIERNDRMTVMVLEDGEATPRRVTVGISTDSEVEVLSGIEAGEMVVSNPTATSQSATQSQGQQGGVRQQGGFGGFGMMLR